MISRAALSHLHDSHMRVAVWVPIVAFVVFVVLAAIGLAELRKHGRLGR